MKKILLFTFVFLLAGSWMLSYGQVDITFRVDMTNETVSLDGVHVAGGFQGWAPGTTAMTLQASDIYAVTLSLNPGDYYEYKFINGNDWPLAENVPAGCNASGNRYFTVPNVSTELEAVCFGSCVVCNPPTVEVTFKVNMAEQTVSGDGVHIAGSFQGWDPSANEMTLDVD
jgi:hypothetical protein